MQCNSVPINNKGFRTDLHTNFSICEKVHIIPIYNKYSIPNAYIHI